MKEKYGYVRQTVEETLRICKDQNVLKEYLKDEEAATIMFTLLDEEKARAFWDAEMEERGRLKFTLPLFDEFIRERMEDKLI